MNEIECDCWEKFEAQISIIYKALENKRNETPIYVSPPLFRGHAKASWKLETTLERYSEKEYSITDYYHLLRSVEPALASFTSKQWNLDHNLKIDERDYGPPPRYDLMVYLRHHGFPSPLLDWSCSPYVAAFFAFQHRPRNEDQNVAIYSYVEHCGKGKGGWAQEAQIMGLGAYVHTHKRHFIQQCQYTICKKYLKDQDRYIYSNHEEAFGRNETDQDLLTKYLLPRSERKKVLSKLNFMNINAYSLFGTEESLMETLAYKEIEIDNNV